MIRLIVTYGSVCLALVVGGLILLSGADLRRRQEEARLREERRRLDAD